MVYGGCIVLIGAPEPGLRPGTERQGEWVTNRHRWAISLSLLSGIAAITGCTGAADCPPGGGGLFCLESVSSLATGCDGGDCAPCVEGAVCDTGNPCMTGVMDCSGDAPLCVPVTDAPVNTECGVGLACNGAGDCNVCVDGAICDTGNPCTLGRVQCVDGSPVCNQENSLPMGAACGSSGACNGSGMCSECIPGAVCNTGNPCTRGRTECVDDVQVCTATEDVPEGTRCAEGLACSAAGACDLCIPGDTCTRPDACEAGVTVCQAGAPVCTGAGPKRAGEICRNQATLCDAPEVCDGRSTVCPADQLMASGEACRAAVDACDQAELCDGASAGCPADRPAPLGAPCAGGVCDGLGGCLEGCNPGTPCSTGNPCERGVIYCTASGPVCQPDGPAAGGTLCRASSGPCDVPEVCTGASSTCPADLFATSATVCRPAAGGGCDVADVCSGGSANCPGDAKQPSGTSCPGGSCDAIGMCVLNCNAGAACDTGVACERGVVDCSTGAAVCQAAGPKPNGTVCRAATGQCDVTEVCNGASTTCGADIFTPNGASCTGGSCDGAGTCVTGCSAGQACSTGNACELGLVDCSSGMTRCLASGPRSAGYVCRAQAGECDVAETCNGSNLTCPADGYAANGTSCTGGSCNGTNMCVVGCTAGASCSTGNVCHIGQIDCGSGAPMCQRTGSQPLGTSCANQAPVDPSPSNVCDGSGSCVSCLPGSTENRMTSCGVCNNGQQTEQRVCGPSATWGGWGMIGGCTGETYCADCNGGTVCPGQMGLAPCTGGGILCSCRSDGTWDPGCTAAMCDTSGICL